MKSDEWDEIMRQAKEDDADGVWIWTCPECDEYTVEMGQQFENGEVVEYTLACLSCEAEVTAPA